MKKNENQNRIDLFIPEMIKWRHYLHQHPETAFQEHNTSRFISDQLKSFGVQIHRGLAKTGVVATLKAGSGKKKIAIRADIDALELDEKNKFSYKSKNIGKMHACGHDGHTAILLGAAKYLSQTRNFNGTIYFIFQPAEEIMGGGKKMIDDGLFKLFPADSVYSMHNIPGLPLGNIAIKSGPIMASMDNFEIVLFGRGGHAAMTKNGNDLLSASSTIITELNKEIKKMSGHNNQVVLSFTGISSSNSFNIFPTTLKLLGTIRTFDEIKKDKIIKQVFPKIIRKICENYKIKFSLNFNSNSPGYPVTSNSKIESELARKIAIDTVGKNKVELNPTPWTASEDFSFMLKEKPGCYIWIGNGTAKNGGVLHNSCYDFNDEILSIGACYWINLAEFVLKKS